MKRAFYPRVLVPDRRSQGRAGGTKCTSSYRSEDHGARGAIESLASAINARS
jgi:hypothetical protein